MRRTTQRTLLMLVLIAAATLVVWSLGRAADTAPSSQASPSHSMTATSRAEGAQRHTATTEPDDSATDPVSGLPWVAESALPAEARATLALIEVGGPFSYPRNDNQVFSNREALLPVERRGYYREFTVDTPGSEDRGPRRIITGAGGEKYWTENHYESFSRIREGR